MSLISLDVIGVLCSGWYAPTSRGMEGWNILNIVVVICVLVWLLFAFGILNHSGDIRVPQVQ